MKNLIGQAWLRLGNPEALSWINIAAVMTLQTAGSAISSHVDFSGNTAEFFACRIFSILTLFPVFWLGRFFLNKMTKPKSAPLVTLGVFFVGLTISTYVFDFLLVSTELAESSELNYRLTASTPGVMTSLTLTSIIVTYAREFSHKNAALVAVANELEQTRAETNQRIAARQADLTNNIRMRINDELKTIDGANSTHDAERMSALIDDVIRPISYSLAQETKPDDPIVFEEQSTKINWRVVSEGAFARNPFHPIAVPLLLGVIGASFLIRTFHAEGLLATLVFMAAFSLVNSFLKELWPKLPREFSTITRSLLYTVAITLVAAAIAPILTWITGFSFTEPLRLASWIVISNIAAWTVTLVTSVNIILRETNKNLNSTVDDLKREVIALNGSYRQLQKGISRVLHGPVQSAIASSLLRLQSSGDLKDQRELSQELRSKISQALDLLNSPAYLETDLERVLAELKELWRGAVEISSTFADEDLKILHEHQSTSYAVAEVVREICSNAIRHGKASRITVKLRLDEEVRIFEIDAVNDGAPLSVESNSGLGSQLFDEVALSWNRRQEATGVRVVVRLPII